MKKKNLSKVFIAVAIMAFSLSFFSNNSSAYESKKKEPKGTCGFAADGVCCEAGTACYCLK